jgi:hypothetical protein
MPRPDHGSRPTVIEPVQRVGEFLKVERHGQEFAVTGTHGAQ